MYRAGLRALSRREAAISLTLIADASGLAVIIDAMIY